MKLRSIVISLFLIAGCASLPTHYVFLDQQRSADFKTLLAGIQDKRVIFIGEIHGTPSIHLLQLEIIKHLHQSGKKVAVALEAFPGSKQEIFNRWIGKELDEYAFERLYRETWTVPYEYYKEMLEYARDEHIPLIAINADNALIGAVSKNGLREISQDFLQEIKFTECATDVRYKEIIDKTYHAAAFPFLCDGQRLRDAIMAFNIAQAVRGSDFTLVVIAGATHVMKIAVPQMLQSHIAVSSTVLLPGTISRVIRRTPDKDIADYIWD
jgi:uncharacterized iron-regulated protein